MINIMHLLDQMKSWGKWFNKNDIYTYKYGKIQVQNMKLTCKLLSSMKLITFKVLFLFAIHSLLTIFLGDPFWRHVQHFNSQLGHKERYYKLFEEASTLLRRIFRKLINSRIGPHKIKKMLSNIRVATRQNLGGSPTSKMMRNSIGISFDKKKKNNIDI